MKLSRTTGIRFVNDVAATNFCFSTNLVYDKDIVLSWEKLYVTIKKKQFNIFLQTI